MAQASETSPAFEIKFTSREVSAWGGMALMKRMLDSMGFQNAATRWDLPEPGSNRGYPPVQLIEQLMVPIWCGAWPRSCRKLAASGEFGQMLKAL